MTTVSPFLRGKRVMRDDIIKVLRDKINDWKIIKDFITLMTLKEPIGELCQFCHFSFSENKILILNS